jgi:two-component system chemotaxis sensor kinase CheA
LFYRRAGNRNNPLFDIGNDREMTIDLSQFHQVFFEESLEGLDVMESALLNLDIQDCDSEAINQIFRAAHSIKGGSATFGFNTVAEFTHVIETLLDQIRAGDRQIEASHVELFLRSVDCLRQMIRSLEAHEAVELTEAGTLKSAFQAILDGGTGSSGTASSNSSEVTVCQPQSGNTDAGHSGVKTWQIYFKPERNVLKTGNEPARMFRELEDLGVLKVVADVSELPAIGVIEPECCYLKWNMTLVADVSRAQIAEAFEWVIDEAELRIEEVSSSVETTRQNEIEPLSSVTPAAVVPSARNALMAVNAEPTADIIAGASVGAGSDAGAADKNTAKKLDKNRNDVSSIRVGIDKVDSLINMVGELVITQSMLGELSRDFDMSRLPKLLEGLDQLSQNTRELQESVMRIRMLPISFTFSRFPRLVHDLCKVMGKKIELKLLGEQTELDKTVMEKIGDPMVHLVRNSLDHGIEKPEERIRAGKPETGLITLNAYHQGGNIIIQIMDDGKGLDRQRILSKAIEKRLVNEGDKLSDEQIYELIFKPGFSTADQVTDISGRGVGMDVVRRNIQELNGSVEVQSVAGKGSTFTIRLPLTLAILDGQLVRSGEHTYILPLISIIESIQTNTSMIHRVAGGCDVLRLRSEYVPIIRLYDILNIKPDSYNLDESILVVAEGDNMKVALVVDDLLSQQQVVIKSLEENYKRVEGVSGATILGNGTVALILDIAGLIKLAGVRRDEYKKIKSGSGEAA